MGRGSCPQGAFHSGKSHPPHSGSCFRGIPTRAKPRGALGGKLRQGEAAGLVLWGAKGQHRAKGPWLGDPIRLNGGTHHDHGTHGESHHLPGCRSRRGPHAGQAISLRRGGIKASILPPPHPVSPFFIQAGGLAPVLSSRLPSKDGLTARSGASLSRRLNAHHLQGETLMQDNTCSTHSAVSPRAPGTPGRWAPSPSVAQCPLAVPCPSSAGISRAWHGRVVPRLDVPHPPCCPLLAQPRNDPHLSCPHF